MHLNKLHTDHIDYLLEIIQNEYGQGISRYIQRWLPKKPYDTDINGRATHITAKKELHDGARLVSNPWQVDVKSPLRGFHVREVGKQLMIGLPENKKITDMVADLTKATPAYHALRGLVFGFPVDEVYEFAVAADETERWRELLKSHGVKLSENYPSGGYSSTCRNGTCTAIIEPGDLKSLQDNAGELGELIKSYRWCPECQEEIGLRGRGDCEHKPVHEPEKPLADRHWHSFGFKPPWR